MPFNTTLFAAFLVAFYALYHFVARSRAHKLWLIAAGSLAFYAASDWRFVPLLLGTALLDFQLARAIGRSRSPRAKKALVAVSVTLNLGVLAIFKYAAFLVENAVGLCHLAGLQVAAPAVRVALPIGISFYTFQSMSYVIDVYRGVLEPRDRALEFLAGVSFFPHLAAGPIIRSSVLLPQLEAPRPPAWTESRRGLALLVVGLFKKTLADLLAPTVAGVFAARGHLPWHQAWAGALAFVGQVYGDFSGYTDMAIGCALLLGFVLPPNFELPFLAATPIERWRRWHISLSSWLHDYLYLPLGGKRRRARNVMITMVLGGLWHGAAWTFVAWGAFEGLLLLLTDVIVGRGRTLVSRPARAVGTVLTMYAFAVGLVLFRSDSIARALRLLRDMHAPVVHAALDAHGAATLAFVAAALVGGHAVSWLVTRVWRRPAILWPALIVWLTCALAFGGASTPFIYFQF